MIRRSKYQIRTDPKGMADRTRDGILFSSKLERIRYDELKLLERAGHIYKLALQVPFNLTVKGPFGEEVIVAKYIADFTYWERGFGTKMVVEDVKGMRTPVYNLKKRMMAACYNVKIKEWPEKVRKVRKVKRG